MLASCCQGWSRDRSLFFRSLAEWISSSQADPPTLKNDGCSIGKPIFLTKRSFPSEDGFGNVLGLPRGPLGTSGACLGGSLGPLDRPKKVSRFILELSWASFARFLLPTMAWEASCEHELANQRLRAGPSATAGAAPMWIRLVRRRTESQILYSPTDKQV